MTVRRLKTPISEEDVRGLRVNDTIFISGTIVTARDEAHRRALEISHRGERLPVNLEGLAIYHCGPLMRRKNDAWEVVAAGPTTSARLENYEEEFIRDFRPRIVIGKGGMGMKTTEAMSTYGAIYGAYTGGAAVLAAKAIRKVVAVFWLDLGMPEAMWVLEVKNFGPLIVAIDMAGNNLFNDVAKTVELNKQNVYRKLDFQP